MSDIYRKIAKFEKSPDIAKKIVAAIWNDVTGRRGWRQEHDQFDDDTRNEIVETWLKNVRAILTPGAPDGNA